MRRPILFLIIGALPLFACGEPEFDTRDDLGIEESQHALLPGDTLLASDSTVDAAFGPCGNKLYAPQTGTGWFKVFEAPVNLTVNQKVLVRGRLRTTTSSTAVLVRFRFKVIQPNGLPSTYFDGATSVNPVDGENNLAGESLAVSGFRVFSAAQAGLHTFVLEADAATSASKYANHGVWSGVCDPLPAPDHTVTISTGSGNSFLDVHAVDPTTLSYVQDTSWAAGYATVTSSNSPFTVLKRTYVVPTGRTGVKAASYLGLTIDNAVASTTAKARLQVKNMRTNAVTYFPSVDGVSYTITASKHHKKAYMEGAISGVVAGDTIEVLTQVWLVSGGSWVHVDTGCAGSNCSGSTTPQSYTAIWPY